MRRWIIIVIVLTITLSALTYGQWRLRAEASTQILAPISLSGLEFRSYVGDGKWIPIALDDAVEMVQLFNESRRQLSRMTTFVFAPRGSWAIALAPSAQLRCDGVVEEWYCLPSHASLADKYITLSRSRSSVN